MGDAHRRIGGVDRLAARSGGAEDIDPEVLLIDLDVEFLGLRQHCDGRRRCVDTTGTFRSRHALHAMHARLELQPGEHAAARHRRDRLLVATDTGVGQLHDLELPAMVGSVALVHAKEIGCEQGSLVATRASTDFQDGILLVGRILGQQHALHRMLEFWQALAQRRCLFFGDRLHVGIGRHRLGILQFPLGLLPLVHRLDERPEIGILLRGRNELLRIERAGGKCRLQFGVTGHDLVELEQKRHEVQPFNASARASSATSR